MPEPPYSGSIGPARKPNSPMRLTRCRGNSPFSSASRDIGATSCSANWRACCWMRFCLDVRSKSIGTLFMIDLAGRRWLGDREGRPYISVKLAGRPRGAPLHFCGDYRKTFCFDEGFGLEKAGNLEQGHFRVVGA